MNGLTMAPHLGRASLYPAVCLRCAAGVARKPLQKNGGFGETNMGLSENSVPLHPMVNDHYPY